MGQARLKTAVLGLGADGAILLQAAADIRAFEIIAVADSDPAPAARFARQYNCAAYDDYRQLIIANQLDCLLVSAPTYACAEYIKAAIKKRVNILKTPPLARDFVEAAELAALARDEGVTFAVLNPLLFSPSMPAFRKHIQPAGAGLIDIVVNAGSRTLLPWQTDPKLAGGGVLLNNCYSIIHAVISLFGLPQQVYTLTSGAAADKQQRLYRTEDTVVMTMKFSDTLLGNLRASRVFHCPGHAQPKHGWPALSITASSCDSVVISFNDHFAVCDCSGQFVEKTESTGATAGRAAEHLANFASTILTPDKIKLVSSADQNLPCMAFIEAAYLSARTLMPEQPQRILAMRKH